MNENASTPVRKFRRSRNDRVIAGVCGGAAELLGVDATILRVVLAVSTLFAGVGPLLYLICWLVVPEE
jgi:phage shock protein C